MRWLRTAALSDQGRTPLREQWEYRRANGATDTYDVEVFVGKPFDVISLKGVDLDQTRQYASFLADTARDLYVHPLVDRECCVICGASLLTAPVALRVLGVPYVRCETCGHVMVRWQPSLARLSQVSADSEGHASTYVDRAAIDARMSQIVLPKLDWCVDQYRKQYGLAPSRLIDVGAGGGHFVAGATARGLDAEGFEPSCASRRFAAEAFAVQLRADDFLVADLQAADLVTLWGLLEYVPAPRDFLRAARRILSNGGLLVVEVPRADALGTMVQAREDAVIARHMDPTSHVNAFSDASLCTALVEEGFAPVAAWYFGMDAYELILQTALASDDNSLVTRFEPWIPILQGAADRGRVCDDIVIAAVPHE